MEEFIKNSAGSGEEQVALVAPLDWGLGHATRCIPLIKRLLEENFRVIIAAEGRQKAILQQEFPSLPFVHLTGYRLRYGRSGWQTVLRIFFQIPKILTAINREHRWLARFLKQNKVDITISDNRYGFRHSSVHSVFITHQLYIKTPFGFFAERLLQRLNYRLIGKFTECWVPDYEGEENLGGILSHPVKLPALSVKYIGPLTRCYKKEAAIKNELLIILSGPEPQRTLLENILLRELKEHHEPVLFIRGLPGGDIQLPPPQSPLLRWDTSAEMPGVEMSPQSFSIEDPAAAINQIRFYNHLSSEELNDAMNTAKLIIARSGYSTVMDIMQLNKPCIFIPTPGQSEQLYLAEYLSAKKKCIFFHQKDFSLQQALNHPALVISKERGTSD